MNLDLNVPREIGCDTDARGDTGRRTVFRNEQFGIIHRVVTRGENPLNWVGLRVKVFAFPNSEINIFETYDTSCERH